jgi:DNA invertase Pin-like site-specific DNA recombinase
MVAIIRKRKRVLVGVNEKGKRIGEYHQRAKLSDHEIELIRSLYDDGISISEIARKFEIPKSYAHDICHYLVRCQFAVRFKEVEVEVMECSDKVID